MNISLNITGKLLTYLVLALGALIMVLPFFWMVNASLMTGGEIQKQPPVWLPASPQFNNYARLLDAMPLFRLYGNSLFVTTATTAGVLITSSLAGFAFAKYQFPGKNLMFVAILTTMMVPFFVTLIPVFLSCDNLAGSIPIKV